MKREKQSRYYSNGNLIIAGEYFVLIGAKALAVPLKYGQQMKVECFKNDRGIIQWKTYELGIPWFNVDFNTGNLSIISTNDYVKAAWLQKLLKTIRNKKEDLFKTDLSFHFTSDINFNTKWGWGSSSSLLVNLANWAGVDPFELNKLVSSGSGYDIAASVSLNPVFYTVKNNVTEIIPVTFNPGFKKSIYFIYLGKKQNTNESIENNIKSVYRNKKLIPVISALTEKIANEENMNEFIRLIVEHEEILSGTLKIPRIKENFFSDFEGEIKSLGAWGGDFAMVVSPLAESGVKKYFKDKGLETVFGFDEIVKN